MSIIMDRLKPNKLMPKFKTREYYTPICNEHGATKTSTNASLYSSNIDHQYWINDPSRDICGIDSFPQNPTIYPYMHSLSDLTINRLPKNILI
jgi:hypothetical protein